MSSALRNLEADSSIMVATREVEVMNPNHRNEKMMWESQKMELTHKVRTLQRRVNDDNERVKELER